MSVLDDLYKKQAADLAKLEARELRGVLELFAQNERGLVGGLVAYIDDGLIGPANQAIRQATQELTEVFQERLEYGMTDAAVMGQGHIAGLGKAAYPGVDVSAFTATLSGVPEKVVGRAMTRIWDDGLNLKDRCWNMGATLRGQLENQLAIGISQGRSVKLLAKDIAQSYEQVRDWQALRLVRSETMGCYREGYVEAGKEKDYVTGYNWVRSNNPGPCPSGECEALAAGSPYPKDSPPGEDESHPNCSCQILAILQDRDEFISSLRDKYAL